MSQECLNCCCYFFSFSLKIPHFSCLLQKENENEKQYRKCEKMANKANIEDNGKFCFCWCLLFFFSFYFLIVCLIHYTSSYYGILFCALKWGKKGKEKYSIYYCHGYVFNERYFLPKKKKNIYLCLSILAIILFVYICLTKLQLGMK